MITEPPQKTSRTFIPVWLITFADLMALLVVFFVLLLSFSDIDPLAYRQVAGSIATVFGVPQSPSYPNLRQRAQQPIWTALEEEIKKGVVSVETREQTVIIRIQEQGSFPSGSAELIAPIKPALVKIGRVLEDTPGQIIVAGHTDNIPIASGRFRSNWELSASRAVTVVHELLKATSIPEQRIVIQGHGEAHPLAPNDTPQNRARNRRVEIILEQYPQSADD